MNLTYTVADVLRTALDKIGVDYAFTDVANIQRAHMNLNIMLGMWSADPDLAVHRIVPPYGYSDLSDTVDLPLEYISAIVFNLAVILSPDYDQKPDSVLVTFAQTTLDAIKTFNIRRISGSIPTNSPGGVH